MLPARLAQLLSANEGLFIGLRLSAAKQGLAIVLMLGPVSQSLNPSPTPSPLLTAQPTPHACSGLALSPRRRLLVSAALNCRQQQKRARERGEREQCWFVVLFADKLGLLLSNLSSGSVPFIKIYVIIRSQHIPVVIKHSESKLCNI